VSLRYTENFCIKLPKLYVLNAPGSCYNSGLMSIILWG
jgi:hypothetical protein